MNFDKELSNNLHQAFMAVSTLRTALYDAVDRCYKLGDHAAMETLLKASDNLRMIDNTVNRMTEKTHEALMKELA